MIIDLWTKIRNLFKRNDTYADLLDKRANLFSKLNSINQDVDKLLVCEQSFIKEGKESDNLACKKQVASKIASTRSEIRHQQTLARIVSTQINIVNVDIRNKSISEQAKIVPLPNIDDLMEESVQTEEMLENMGELNDAASQLHHVVNINMNQEELDILKELESPILSTPSTPSLSEVSNKQFIKSKTALLDIDYPKQKVEA